LRERGARPHETVRLVIIGAGKMGAEHARTFAAVAGVEIVGVVSRSGTTAHLLAERYGITHAGACWQDIVEASRAHGVVVATTHSETHSVTAEAIERGLHVLAEKPVSLDPSEVRELHEQAIAAGVLALVGMNRRFFRSVLAAIDIVRLHGPVVGVSLQAPDPVRIQRTRANYDPSVFEHWTRSNTLHAIDLLRVIAGEVTSVRGASISTLGEISRVASLTFDSGALGTYSSHGITGGKWQLQIHGQGVEATLSPIEHGTIRIGTSTQQLPNDDQGLKYGTHGQAEAFVSAIRSGHLAPPGCDMEDHARSLELAAILEALPTLGTE